MYENAKYYTVSDTNTVAGIKVDINGVTHFVPLDPENTEYKIMMDLVANEQLTISAADAVSNT